MRKRLLWALPLLMVLFPAVASATTSGFSTVVNGFEQQTTSWYDILQMYAKDIFYTLFGVDFVYLVAQWLIGGKDVHEIFTSFIKKLITIGFFYTVLLNAYPLVSGIINGFHKAGENAAGGAPSSAVSSLLGTAAHIAVTCIQGPVAKYSGVTGGVKFVWSTITSGGQLEGSMIIGMLMGLIVGLIALAALIYVALEYVAVELEALIVGSVGIIMMGFSGSRWTAQHAEGYLKYALAVGVRFMVLTIYLAFVELHAQPIVKNLLAGVQQNGGTNIGETIGAYVNILMFVALIAWLAKKLPGFASSILGGGSSLSGSDLFNAVKAGGIAAAAAVTGGAALAMGAGAAAGSGVLGAAEAASGAADAAGGLAKAGSSGVASGGEAGANAMEGATPAAETVPAPEKPASTESSPASSGGAEIIPAPTSLLRATQATQSGNRLQTAREAAKMDAPQSSTPGKAQATSEQANPGSPSSVAQGTSNSEAQDAAMVADTAMATEATRGMTAAKAATEGASTPATETGGPEKAIESPAEEGIQSASAATEGASTPATETGGPDDTVSSPTGKATGGQTTGGTSATSSKVDPIDHRSSAPNTPTKTVSGGSHDVPAPATRQSVGTQAPSAPSRTSSGAPTPTTTDTGSQSTPAPSQTDTGSQSTPATQKQGGGLHEALKGINERVDTLHKSVGHVENVVSPGKEDTAGVNVPNGLGFKHSE